VRLADYLPPTHSSLIALFVVSLGLDIRRTLTATPKVPYDQPAPASLDLEPLIYDLMQIELVGAGIRKRKMVDGLLEANPGKVVGTEVKGK
jgi:hypothetical protein